MLTQTTTHHTSLLWKYALRPPSKDLMIAMIKALTDVLLNVHGVSDSVLTPPCLPADLDIVFIYSVYRV